MASTQRQVGEVLSELARDNYRGLIDPHTYRLQRAKILDQLVVDEDEGEASTTTRPQAPTRDRRAGNPRLSDPANQRRRDVDRVREQVATAEVLQIVDAAKQQAREAAQAAAASPDVVAAEPPQPAAAQPAAPASTVSGGRPPWLLIAGVAAALVLAGGLLLMLGGDDSPQQTLADQDSVFALTAGEKLIDDFVTADNWSEAALIALTENWQLLLPSERRQAVDSAPYRNFAHAVRRRLLESAALQELDGSESARDHALMALAVAMDLQPPLLDSIDEPAPPAAEPQPETLAARSDDRTPVPDALPDKVPELPPPVPAADPVDRAVTKPAPKVAITEPRPPPPVAAAKTEATTPTANEAPGEVATPAVVAPSDSGCFAGLLKTRQRSCADALQSGGEGPRMAIVKAGSFTMGSQWAPEEQPPHLVTVSKAFAIAAHEISHDEYSRFCTTSNVACPANPWKAGDYPVVGVSRAEALAYTRWLSEQTGRSYRLPTEAEWEYAARAGVESRYPSGEELLPVQARYASERDAGAPWPRSYRDAPRNAFGLYNSIGNVREWVADAWHDSHAGAPADGSARAGADSGAHVVRGGSYADEATALRLSSRARMDANARNNQTGFRVVLDF